jgi:hypothetical protein
MTAKLRLRVNVLVFLLSVAPVLFVSAAPAASALPQGQLHPAKGIPSLSLSISSYTVMGPPPTVVVLGHWDFPNYWAGQAAPDDIATLQTRAPDCVHMSRYDIHTYSYQHETFDKGHQSLGDLQDTNLAFSSPIWAIRDYDKDFVPQADHGTVSVTLSNYCGKQVTFPAAFSYDANQGGSETGVSAGWGIFSVTFGSKGLERKQSTPPIYITL